MNPMIEIRFVKDVMFAGQLRPAFEKDAAGEYIVYEMAFDNAWSFIAAGQAKLADPQGFLEIVDGFASDEQLAEAGTPADEEPVEEEDSEQEDDDEK